MDFGNCFVQRPGETPGSGRGVCLSRAACLLLALAQVIQVVVCCAAVWTVWQIRTERRQWLAEKQELVARLEQVRSERISDLAPDPAMPTRPVSQISLFTPPAADDAPTGPLPEDVPATTPKDGDGPKAWNVSLPAPGESAGPAAPESSPPADPPADPSVGPLRTADLAEVDTGASRIDSVQTGLENGLPYCSFEIRNARPGVQVNGHAACWLLDVNGRRFPLDFRAPAFRIKHKKAMRADGKPEIFASFAAPAATALVLEIDTEDGPALRARLPLPADWNARARGR